VPDEHAESRQQDINDQPPHLLAWRTVPGAPVTHAGSVRFVPHGAATRIEVSLQYDHSAVRWGTRWPS
jgi:uncharacterized membrane protein